MITLPAGFALPDPGLLSNTGPSDAAAGRFAGPEPTEAALWSRQALTDGRLRAVAVVPPAEGTGPDRFQAVHRTAERVAAGLGIGAVEVAVCWADPVAARHAVRPAGPWSVAAYRTGGVTILSTDAIAPAATLETALGRWPATDGTVLFLASGASGRPVEPTELGAAVGELAT